MSVKLTEKMREALELLADTGVLTSSGYPSFRPHIVCRSGAHSIAKATASALRARKFVRHVKHDEAHLAVLKEYHPTHTHGFIISEAGVDALSESKRRVAAQKS